MADAIRNSSAISTLACNSDAYHQSTSRLFFKQMHHEPNGVTGRKGPHPRAIELGEQRAEARFGGGGRVAKTKRSLHDTKKSNLRPVAAIVADMLHIKLDEKDQNKRSRVLC